MSVEFQKTLQTTARASQVVVRRGMGPMAWLFIIFVLCKIFSIGPIAGWSWWLVFLPLYGPFLLVLSLWLAMLVLFGIVFLLFLLGVFLHEWWQRRKWRKSRLNKQRLQKGGLNR